MESVLGKMSGFMSLFWGVTCSKKMSDSLEAGLVLVPVSFQNSNVNSGKKKVGLDDM